MTRRCCSMFALSPSTRAATSSAIKLHFSLITPPHTLFSGSVRVDPDTPTAHLLRLLQQHNVVGRASSPGGTGSGGGRIAVFYCSIGYRSSAAVARLLEVEVRALRRAMWRRRLTACSLSRQFSI
jgi:hypothetical protein